MDNLYFAPRRRWLILAAFLALTLAISAIGGALTAPKIPTWYAGLAKPGFNPPAWLFAPVWTVLYILLAIVGWRLWGASEGPLRRQTLRLYAAQLLLNLLWTPAFFTLESPRLALGILILMVMLAIGLLMDTFRLDRLAAAMLLPYVGWISFASLLNTMIVHLN